MNDLTGDKKQPNQHNDTFHVDSPKVYGDIEDDLALILNDKQPPNILESNEENDQQQTKYNN